MQPPLLQLSGETGGGQLLRSSLSLSMVTGKAFRMTNIRGKRPKPGLMRQHLTCVKAAAQVCDATVDGAELGSAELVFSPGKVRAGDYTFSIGSGGSTTLVFQTVLPALLLADGPSTLRIEGGTHNPLAPPFEFMDQCFLPVLRTMGAEVAVSLERHGFMQAGGGVLTATIAPINGWKKLRLLDRGAEQETFGRVLHAFLPEGIAQREVSTALGVLNWPREKISVEKVENSSGPGNALLLGVRFDHVCEISTGIAQMGKSAEAVATSAAKGLRTYLASNAPVGVHLADQLLLPMALAGEGEFATLALSNHVRSNMALISQFLPVQFEVEEREAGGKLIRLTAIKA